MCLQRLGKPVHVLVSPPCGLWYCELHEQVLDGRTRDGSVNGLDVDPGGINLIPLEVPAWLCTAASAPSLRYLQRSKEIPYLAIYVCSG